MFFRVAARFVGTLFVWNDIWIVNDSNLKSETDYSKNLTIFSSAFSQRCKNPRNP